LGTNCKTGLLPADENRILLKWKGGEAGKKTLGIIWSLSSKAFVAYLGSGIGTTFPIRRISNIVAFT